ncbi:putative ras GTP exchange factor son of sevenless [Fasciola hepatica]|uniref:Ras GTP exchange factor son of sevenless n=1 Tax=Fasciola hepatica TaxID=6192 RepID=A0A4E0R8M1_FASHE|nr:putative ras GTP exchange factor son of sevenless [Fasciola hepatica]
MSAVMYRHTSTVSLVSQSSVQLEAGLLVQCLNKYKENLEFGCERVLEALYSRTDRNNTTSLSYCAASSGKNSPNPVISTSPSRTGSQIIHSTACTNSRCLDPRARESLGQHLIEILATLVLPEPPQSIGEVDIRLSDGLPSIPDKLMPSESDAERYRNLAEKGRKKGLRLPVDKIYMALKEFNGRFNHSVCIYIVAVAEHIIGNFLQVAICYEEKALTENLIRASTIETLFILYRDRNRSRRKTFEHRLANRFPQDYDKCVGELDSFLHSSLEQMNLLLRVFREPVLTISGLEQNEEDNVHLIFGSILDLYNNMRIFLDTVDAEEEDSYVTRVAKTSFASSISSTPVATTNTSTDSTAVLDTGTEPHSVISLDSPSPNSTSHPDSSSRMKPLEDASSDQSPSPMDAFRASVPQPIRILSGFQRHRLVGVCLLELAEDDSLHTFSQYATTVLDSLSRDRAWALCETESFVSALCRLSRTILHTASWNKMPGSPIRSCHSNALDLRLTDVHSVTCSRCRFWDSVMSTPRRRSTSSNAIGLVNGSQSSPSPSAFLSVANSGHRTHRSSHSSSVCNMPVGASECNFLVNAFKYLLPRLLLLPIFQFFYLHEMIETLHRSAYDDEESARLSEVLSMLRKTRLTLERDLSKQSWVCLHLARLISTGHLVGRYLPLYLDLLAGSTCPPSPISGSGSHTTPPSPTTNHSNGAFSSTEHPSCTTQNSSNCVQFCPNAAGSVNFGFSTASGYVSGYAQPGKAEEIERLLGGKDKLLAPNGSRLELGDFVMEGRLHLRTETKRSSAEHIAYLFTGLLVICKWQERCATLNPSLSQPSVLRVKHRIPLDSIHVTDMAPIVQPNLPLYVGNSGTVTSSAVGAAVLAAASAAACGMSGHLDDCSSFSSSGLNGSTVGHTGLVNVGLGASGGSGMYPYSLELEFIDLTQIPSTNPSQGSAHRVSGGSHTRHTSPLQKPHCPLTLPPTDLSRGDHTNGGTVNNGSTGCADPNCPSGLTVHHVWLSFRTQEEKADWMASLLSIQLHRLFLRYIRTLPKIEVPLRIPSPASYRFSQPDSPNNIVFETGIPLATTAHNSDVRGSLDSSEEDLGEDVCIPLETEDYMREPPTTTGNADMYNSANFNPPVDSEVRPESGSAATNSAHSPTQPYANADMGENDSATLTAENNSDVLRRLASRTTLLTQQSPGQPPSSALTVGYPPQIHTATLDKIIERMTYPSYFDANLVNTFLLVYRRVTTPEVFLDLLIDRFRIPDPEFLPAELKLDTERGQLESPAQHMLKRFRSGYKKRVQARVIMVLSRWVRSSRYYQNDFLPRPDLCRRLSEFLATVQARHLQSAVRRIVQHLQNPAINATDAEVDVVSGVGVADSGDGIRCSTNFDISCPNTVSVRRAESFTDGSRLRPSTNAHKPLRLNLTLIHPYKLAEQVTLYEWELYRRIRFWEVDGRGRADHSTPNLDRSKAFSNHFRNWLVYAILSEPHPDDRVVSIQRVIDLMLIMEQMNNLQGSQEAKSALISAAVFRLRKSFQTIKKLRHYRQVVDRIRREATVGPKPQSTGLSVNSYSSLFGPGLPFATKASRAHERRIKDLEKRQASGEASNPCVPFIAAGVMTRLIHLDLRHSDTVRTESGVEMINCWKHRQLAEVVERYLAFQRVPYRFEVDPEIREMLEHLDPLGQAAVSSELEFERRMYELSESYEPRESDASSETAANCTPAGEPERRMSKEAIQAANLLSAVPLKERMSLQSVFNFSVALSSSSSGSCSSRLFSPTCAAGSSGSRPSRKGFKSPQSVSPPAHSNVSRSQDRDMAGKMQRNKYQGISSTGPSTELTSGPVDTVVQPTNSDMVSSTGSHQHSMSDSQVFTINRRLSPHHQTMHSIGTSGVSIGPSTTVGSDARNLINNRTQPTTPGLHTEASPTAVGDPLPPPLPPRQSGQNSSGSSSAKFHKSPSPVPLLITPSVFLSPRVSSPHHHNLNQNDNTGNSTTPPWLFMSDIVVDNPIYLPQTTSPPPPPLPPKSSVSCSRTTIRAANGSASSSPHSHQHILQAPSLDQQFLFGPDGNGCSRDLPPPLPPRQQAVSTSPTVPRVTSRPVSAPQNNDDPRVAH